MNKNLSKIKSKIIIFLILLSSINAIKEESYFAENQSLSVDGEISEDKNNLNILLQQQQHQEGRSINIKSKHKP